MSEEIIQKVATNEVSEKEFDDLKNMMFDKQVHEGMSDDEKIKLKKNINDGLEQFAVEQYLKKKQIKTKNNLFKLKKKKQRAIDKRRKIAKKKNR